MVFPNGGFLPRGRSLIQLTLLTGADEMTNAVIAFASRSVLTSWTLGSEETDYGFVKCGEHGTQIDGLFRWFLPSMFERSEHVPTGGS